MDGLDGTGRERGLTLGTAEGGVSGIRGVTVTGGAAGTGGVTGSTESGTLVWGVDDPELEGTDGVSATAAVGVVMSIGSGGGVAFGLKPSASGFKSAAW